MLCCAMGLVTILYEYNGIRKVSPWSEVLEWKARVLLLRPQRNYSSIQQLSSVAILLDQFGILSKPKDCSRYKSTYKYCTHAGGLSY